MFIVFVEWWGIKEFDPTTLWGGGNPGLRDRRGPWSATEGPAGTV